MEEIFFFIPSSLLFLAMGFFGISAALAPHAALLFAFGPIALAGACGVLLGAFIMYGFAYWGGKPFILKFGKYCGVRWEEVKNLHRFFDRGYADEVVLTVLRAIPIFPISVVSLLCGAVRIRPLAFAITTFVGTLFRVGSLALFGWYVGREFSFYAEKIALFEQIVIIVAGFFAFYAVLRIRRRKKLPTTH